MAGGALKPPLEEGERPFPGGIMRLVTSAARAGTQRLVFPIDANRVVIRKICREVSDSRNECAPNAPTERVHGNGTVMTREAGYRLGARLVDGNVHRAAAVEGIAGSRDLVIPQRSGVVRRIRIVRSVAGKANLALRPSLRRKIVFAPNHRSANDHRARGADENHEDAYQQDLTARHDQPFSAFDSSLAENAVLRFARFPTESWEFPHGSRWPRGSTNNDDDR